MLRKLWQAIVEAFTPHWDDGQDSTEIVFGAAAMEEPSLAAPIQAAKEEDGKVG